MKITKKLTYEFGMVCVALLISIPLLQALSNSFKSQSEIVLNPLGFPKFEVGFGNFTVAFNSMNLVKSYFISLTIAIGALFIAVFFASLASYAIARIKHPLFNLAYWFYFVCILLPVQSGIIPLVFLMKKIHLTNTLPGIIFLFAAAIIPFFVFLYTGFIRSIPRELDEAAYCEGSSFLRTYFSIIFPLLKPATASLVVVFFVVIWNSFFLPLIFLNGGTYPTVTIELFSFFTTRGFTNYGAIYAGVILAIIPVIILFISCQKYFVAGLSSGAIKG